MYRLTGVKQCVIVLLADGHTASFSSASSSARIAVHKPALCTIIDLLLAKRGPGPAVNALLVSRNQKSALQMAAAVGNLYAVCAILDRFGSLNPSAPPVNNLMLQARLFTVHTYKRHSLKQPMRYRRQLHSFCSAFRT